LPQEHATCIAAFFRKVAATGQRAQGAREMAPVSGDHHQGHWDWELDPLCDADGKVRYLCVTIRKIPLPARSLPLGKPPHIPPFSHDQTPPIQPRRVALIRALKETIQQAPHAEALGRLALALLKRHTFVQHLMLYGMDPQREHVMLLAAIHQDEQPCIPSSFDDDPVPTVEQARRQHVPCWFDQSEDGQKRIFIPLWYRGQCEGILMATVERNDPRNEETFTMLQASGPVLAEAFAYTRLHATIAQEQQRLSAVLDQLPGGVVLVEATTGLIRYANPAAAHLLGIAHARLIGAPLNAVAQQTSVSSIPQRAWNFALIQALAGETVTNQELVVTRSDGTRSILLSAAAPLRTNTGLIAEAVLVFQDITAQKHLEYQKNEFLAVANHELRTPLTVIVGFVELLQLSLSKQGDDPFRDYALTNMAKASEQMTHLIEEMLDAFRLGQTPLALYPAMHHLDELITRLVEPHRYMTSTHQIALTLEKSASGEPLRGWVDANRIEQALRNLLSNALKYSPQGSRVEVGMRPRPGPDTIVREVLIWVKDEGRGIAPEHVPHIFER
ncbi:MAG: PAS domain-containing protein, partial [Ktedonobacteraceae bacterium]|nr:PAS domain-containing protein [Ktedonobacteraceae bacterium]